MCIQLAAELGAIVVAIFGPAIYLFGRASKTKDNTFNIISIVWLLACFGSIVVFKLLT